MEKNVPLYSLWHYLYKISGLRSKILALDRNLAGGGEVGIKEDGGGGRQM